MSLLEEFPTTDCITVTIVFFNVLHNHVEHLRREAVVASSRLTYKLMDTLNTG